MATIDVGRIKLSLQGDWSNSIVYTVGDMVLFKNKIWILKRAYTPNSSTNYAPGTKSMGHQEFISKEDLLTRTSIGDYDLFSATQNLGPGSTNEEIGVNDEYLTINDDPRFAYNYRQFKNTHSVKVTGTTPNFKFVIDGVTANIGSALQLLEGETYGFEQHDQTNYLMPLSFSLAAEPSAVSMFATGNVKYFLNNTEVTETFYRTQFATDALFRKSAHRRVELTVPIGSTIIYPFNNTYTASYNGTGISVTKSWEGYLYWDEVQTNLRYRGDWSSNIQYSHNDLVTIKNYPTHKLFAAPSPNRLLTMGSELYRCLVDNIDCAPVRGTMEKTRSPLMTAATTTSGRLSSNVNSRQTKWESFSGDTENNAAAWFPNQGPIAWPYKHHTCNGANVYRLIKYIDKNGTVWVRGGGSDGDTANGDGNVISFFSEICFKFREWDDSEDRNRGGFQERRGTKYTRHGNVPKCIQMEQGYGHTLYLFDNGEVKHSGYGGQGQSGTGNFTSYNQPTNINGLEHVRIIKVALNITQEDTAHTCMALSEDGDVYTWGYNGYGQLGFGRTENWASARKIPREYFGNRKIIDIAISGNAEAACFARTSDDNIYAWGRNNSGWLGTNDTTDRYRPNLMQGWNPSANGGIRVFQVAGYSSNGVAYILDGNGFIWSCGYGGMGNRFSGNTSNVNTFTQATGTPGGDIVDIWAVHWNSYHSTFARLKNGTTYFAGASRSYYVGATGATGDTTTPALLNAKMNNLKEVHILGTSSDVATAYYLFDNGKMLTQGYDSYNSLPNPFAGSNYSGEDGTFLPFHAYVPAGTRITSICGQGIWQSTNYFGMISFVGTENGQLFSWGYSGNYVHGSNDWNNAGDNGGIMTQGGQGR
jgi:alpha-tubulin suppressor-like RCC1 family protein